LSISHKKLDLSKEKIESLDVFIKKEIHNEQNKAILHARYSDESDRHQIYLESVPNLKSFQETISIETGIIVHLIRSSLDNSVFERALLFTRGNIAKPKNIQFAIFDSEVKFNRNTMIDEMSQRDKDVIRSYQPFLGSAGRPDSYSGPYIHQLSHLQDLSNTDKHRSVVDVTVDPNSFEMNTITSPIMDAWSVWTRENPKQYFENFTPVEMKPGAVAFEAYVENYNIAMPCFAGFGIACVALDERRPIIPTLQRIESFARLVINDLYS